MFVQNWRTNLVKCLVERGIMVVVSFEDDMVFGCGKVCKNELVTIGRTWVVGIDIDYD